MNKKFCVAALAALMVIGSVGVTYAADGVYMKGSMKYVISDDIDMASEGINVTSDVDNGYGFGVAAGYKFDAFRVEAEVASQKADIDNLNAEANGDTAHASIGSGDVRMTTYMVNGYYDIDLNKSWGLYVMGGMGYGTADYTVQEVSGDDGGFAWKGGAGAYYNLNEEITLDLGYEYLSLDNAGIDEVSGLTSNNIIAAVRYQF